MTNKNTEKRRMLLKAIGGTALLPLAGALSACSGDEAPDPAPESPAASEPDAAQAPAAEAPPSAAQAMPALSEDDPQAKSLGYVEDATTVDSNQYPRYQAGQLCENCALYAPQQGSSGRGGCSIFPGKSVAANGWCNVYAPKA